MSIKSIFKPTTKKAKKSGREDYIINLDSPFALVEAFRAIRTNLSFAVARKDTNQAQIIAITSPLPNEGKSTIASNLAITYSVTKSKVLLIDCDLRKPRISNFLDTKIKMGLSDYLSGQAEIKDIICETNHQNLSVVYSGPIPPNALELLNGRSMEALLTEMASQYDVIIIDTPPLNTVSDSLSLVNLVDGFVVVVKSRVSTHSELKTVLRKLEFAEAKVLGVVLNAHERSKTQYSKYSYNYYDSSKNN